MSSATYHQQADAQLYSLAEALRVYDGINAELRDNRLEVTRWQPGGTRRDTITCNPRPADCDRLWFWTSRRTPITEADRIADAALAIAGSLRT